MFISIQQVLRGREDALDRHGEFNFLGADFPAYEVPRPVPYVVSVKPEGSLVRIGLEFTAVLQAPCARCLAPAKQELHIQKEYVVRESDLADEEAELPFDAEGRLDMQEVAYQEILMEAPLTLLCSDECEGLCPRCGKAKNECGCPKEPQGDERLQVLRQLLSLEDE